MQKLVYCIWNKYWAEELKGLNKEYYILKDFKFELSKDAIELMSERNYKVTFKMIICIEINLEME